MKLSSPGMSGQRAWFSGPVLHTIADRPQATREPLQFGAEIFGHAGLEADLEVQELALEGLQAIGLKGLVLDLADVRLVQGVLQGLGVADRLDAATQDALLAALAAKDAATLRELASPWSPQAVQSLVALTRLYGSEEILLEARRVLPDHSLVRAALDDLQWLATHLRRAHPEVRIGFDLADLSGYAYYSGSRFAVYGEGHADALLRGGRYDEVGAIFGRRRPAVGFSLDLKIVGDLLSGRDGSAPRSAIRAPWGEDPALRQAVRQLRLEGHTVVCVLPGHEHEVQEFDCDRELALLNGQWSVRSL